MWEILVTHPNASKINSIVDVAQPPCHCTCQQSQQRLAPSMLTIDFCPPLVLGHVLP